MTCALRRSFAAATSMLPVVLIGCASGSASNSPARDVPPWLVARPGTAALFDDEHAPCDPKGRGYARNGCTASRVVRIVSVEPRAFAADTTSGASDDPFASAAVTVEDAGKARHVRGSALRLMIPDGTDVFCPKVGWWNPPSEFFDGPRGGTRLIPPVRLRMEKLVRVVDGYGDAFVKYRIDVLDGTFAGERGADDKLSPTCEPADRPGVKLVFH